MPLDPHRLAQELFDAYRSGAVIPTPPSARDADFDMDVAYQTEEAFAALRTEVPGTAAGTKAVGFKAVGVKVGYANKALWRVLKLETLVWARMYEDTVLYARGGAADYVLPPHRAPKIEPELVFKLKQPIVTAGLDAAAALALVDWIAIGFEIIDCPFPDWQVKPADFVAAFGLHLGLVIGEPLVIGAAAIPILVEQLASFKLKISKNGEFVEEGAGKNSLRSPALCLAELGGAMPKRGKNLAAGDLISSGTLTAGHLIHSGETWTVDVEGLPLAGLSINVK
jgi:2-oxo-3-hexenedioate decarboxylase